MSKGMRVLAVTGGLIATGMVVGALCAMVAFPLIFLPLGLSPDVSESALLAIAALFGAIIGGVMAPVVAWGLLRRVPLGRAVGWSAVGTVVGAVAGMIVQENPVTGAVAGFVAAAIWLWARHRPTPDVARVPR
jgi:hypothetical protein